MHLKIFFKNLKQKIRKDADEGSKSNLAVMLNNYDCTKFDDDRGKDLKMTPYISQMIEEKKLNLTYIQKEMRFLENKHDNFRHEHNASDYLETILNESSYESENYRRDRSRNYTEEEKIQLLEIVKK